MTSRIGFQQMDERICALMLCLFERLEHYNIVYCVLRNYEKIPEDLGNDVDMLVASRQVCEFEHAILSAAKDTGWELIKRPVRYGYQSYWFQEKHSMAFVHFDIWSVIAWKGLRWADADAVLLRRRRYKQFFVPDLSDEACISFLKDLIQTGGVKEKYRMFIKHTIHGRKSDLAKTLEWSVGKSLTVNLLFLAENSAWEEVSRLQSSIRRGVLYRSVLRNPLEPVKGYFRFVVGYAKSLIVYPSGMFIVIIGPDGSGKSSIARGLTTSLGKLFPQPIYRHGRFNILPDLRRVYDKTCFLFGSRPSDPEQRGVNATHDMTQHSVGRAMVYLLYYLFDYLFGYLLTAKVRVQGKMLVFDRYCYDYVMSPRFSKVPRVLIKGFLKLVPRPDALLYLKCDANEIHKRKPELTSDQIRYQQRMAESHLCQLDYYHVIDTGVDLQESVDYIYAILSAKLKERGFRRDRQCEE